MEKPKVVEPDLLLNKSDYSEILFAETKRLDTHHKIRENQIKGLALLELLQPSKVEVYKLNKEGKWSETVPYIFLEWWGNNIPKNKTYVLFLGMNII